jgi:hypothetical protein
VLDDLDWGDGPDVETIELTTPADVLRRVFGRLSGVVADERVDRQAGWIENRQLEERNRLVGEACKLVLEALGAEESG